jgi:hypothetical protein
MGETKCINTYVSTTLQEIDLLDLVVAARIILKRSLKLEWNVCWIGLATDMEQRRAFVISVMDITVY